MKALKRSRRNKAVAALLLLPVILVACSTATVYYSFAHTSLYGWEKNDTLTFDIPPLEASSDYDQSVALRMTSEFPFTSISLIVEQHVVPGNKVYTDTLKCRITDERGNFLGSGVSIYQYEYPLRGIALRRGDSIHVSVRHNMKREIIPGVSDIGLKIRKLK